MNTLSLIREAFGDRPFSRKEAALVLGLRNPGPTLNVLKKSGAIERMGRARYRVLPSDRSSAIRAASFEELRQRLLDFPGTVALDGPDAVAAWTMGRWSAGRLAGVLFLYVAVDEADYEAFTKELDGLPAVWGTANDPPPRGAVRVIVRKVSNLRRVGLDGEPVLERAETLRLIRENPIAYGGAEDWMR